MTASPFPPRRMTWLELAGVLAAAAALGALAAAMLAGGASTVFAAGVPVPITVSDTATYRGELTRARDVDLFTVRLEAGHDYAIAFQMFGPTGRVELLDPRGRKIGEAISDADTNGLEARPAATGTHTLRVSYPEPVEPRERADYRLTVRKDCPRYQTATRCVLPLGRTTSAKHWDWITDVDTGRVALSAGRLYSATLTPLAVELTRQVVVDWLDRAGHVLSTSGVDCFNDGGPCTAFLRAGATGSYYLRFRQGFDEGGPYTVRVDLR